MPAKSNTLDAHTSCYGSTNICRYTPTLNKKGKVP